MFDGTREALGAGGGGWAKEELLNEGTDGDRVRKLRKNRPMWGVTE